MPCTKVASLAAKRDWRRGDLGMSPRMKSLTAGVAASLLAATLLVQGCKGRRNRSELQPSTEVLPALLDSTKQLKYQWLVPPDPALEPPLAAPVEIAVDAERRRLLVLESQPPGLRVYDLATGRFIRTLGGPGDGPGEYRYPISLAVNREGVAAVLSMAGRVTFWGTDHALLGSVRTGPGLPTDILAARADSFYVKVDRFPPLDVAEFRVVAPDTALAGSRFNDEAIPGTDEIGHASRNHSYAVAAGGSGGLLISPPGPEYLIMRVGSTGTVRAVIRRADVAPLRRSAAEIEAIRRRVRRNFAAAGRAAPTDINVPVFRSHIARLVVAGDGSLWALTQRGDSATTVVDQFSPEGRFIGSHRIGLRASQIALTDKGLYLLVLSRLDLPAIAVADRPETTRTFAEGE